MLTTMLTSLELGAKHIHSGMLTAVLSSVKNSPQCHYCYFFVTIQAVTETKQGFILYNTYTLAEYIKAHIWLILNNI